MKDSMKKEFYFKPEITSLEYLDETADFTVNKVEESKKVLAKSRNEEGRPQKYSFLSAKIRSLNTTKPRFIHTSNSRNRKILLKQPLHTVYFP